MKTDSVAEFSLDDFDATDEADMVVRVNGDPTTWVWTFAGPGHSQAIAQSNRLARERLHREREKEQARANGKKWEEPEETVEEAKARNVNWVVERIVTWSPVKLNGEMVPFTPEAARKLLMDPRKGALYVQAIEFLSGDRSFMKRSAKG